MTEERKQALIAACAERVKAVKNYCACEPQDKEAALDLTLVEIALAALTAPPIKVDDSMALAFHKALNDGGVGHEDLEEIKVGLEAALCNIPRPASAADLAELVPDEMSEFPGKEIMDRYFNWTDKGDAEVFAVGFNACRAAILRNIEEAK